MVHRDGAAEHREHYPARTASGNAPHAERKTAWADGQGNQAGTGQARQNAGAASMANAMRLQPGKSRRSSETSAGSW